MVVVFLSNEERVRPAGDGEVKRYGPGPGQGRWCEGLDPWRENRLGMAWLERRGVVWIGWCG
jgi:hypothetical protein